MPQIRSNYKVDLLTSLYLTDHTNLEILSSSTDLTSKMASVVLVIFKILHIFLFTIKDIKDIIKCNSKYIYSKLDHFILPWCDNIYSTILIIQYFILLDDIQKILFMCMNIWHQTCTFYTYHYFLIIISFH